MGFWEFVGLYVVAFIIRGGMVCIADGLKAVAREIRTASQEARKDWDD